MLQLTDIFVKYGDRTLLDKVTVTVSDLDKVGIIGRNGAGKSTLFKIIAGQTTPDKGDITMPSDSRIGFLHQEMNIPKGKTVLAESLSSFEDLKQMEHRMDALNNTIASRTDYESKAYEKLLTELSELTEQFHLLGGHNMEAKAEKILKGLGFKPTDFNRLTEEFSGGWQMRIELAKMLLQQPEYLLLDEPTNHLDIESIIWLEAFLKKYEGVVMVISHDKQFLDNVTSRTLEIELGQLYDYKAPYSKAMAMRTERREKMQAAFENQQKVIAQKERTINRFMAKATKTSMAQSMQKQLDKMDRVNVAEEDTAAMNIRFPDAPRSGQIVIEGQNITKVYDDLTVLKAVDFKIERGERVAFVGQNGQGKTTLAKILIHEIPASEGKIEKGYNLHIGYYAQNQAEKLDLKRTVLQTMEAAAPPEMRTKLRGMLGAFLFSGEDVDKKVSVLSGGERARLALACMMLRPINLLVLDEPTNHLDIISKEVLKNALLDYEGTLIVVSHDRDFLGGLTGKTIEFRDKKLHTYLGDVNYFLEKRAVSNMREVEKTAAANKSDGPKKRTQQALDEKRQLERAIRNFEKKIEKREAEIKALEAQMATPEFYNEPTSVKIIEKHQSLKQELDSLVTEWENAHLQLEASESN